MELQGDKSNADSADPFGSTRWSLVLDAAGDGTLAVEALETLCRTYWFPVYSYVRLRTPVDEDAYDLTQGFFADLFERNSIAVADPMRGKFRAFLLTLLKNFLINQQARNTALKRGGGRVTISLDRDVAERRLAGSGNVVRTPDQEFERRWALALLEQVFARLSAEQAAAGREMEFCLLRPFLAGEPAEQSQADVAKQLKTTPEAVRAALYRLRKRYRTLLRDEVAQTVRSPQEIDEELARLISAVSC